MMPPNTTEISNQSSMASECPKCLNKGRYLVTDENGYEYAKECECGILRRQIMANRLRFANLPESLKDVRLNSFSVSVYRKDKQTIRNACNAIKYWLDHFEEMKERGMGLYLFSEEKGSGKTRMAASIANELIHEKKVMVKFATSMQIISEIKSSWNKEHGVSESLLLDQLVTTEVLFVDDFGTEKATDWISEKFYSIINGRYVDKKITIFTSNMSLNDLKYDERITNRIKERNYLIPFPEESIREYIAEHNKAEILGGGLRKE